MVTWLKLGESSLSRKIGNLIELPNDDSYNDASFLLSPSSYLNFFFRFASLSGNWTAFFWVSFLSLSASTNISIACLTIAAMRKSYYQFKETSDLLIFISPKLHFQNVLI
ncbi:hypothetical protein VNO77_10100 [Canavalia gladiata]|uniref:Uncharacterized protein n=1 Tax=Canavalia gladiata TaxID=3824 RepID=A0AAN9QUJ9_CANGL